MTSVFSVAPERVARGAAGRASFAVASFAAFLGLISGLACVGVRLVFRLLQWSLVRDTGFLPKAAAGLSPAYRVSVPIAGAALASLVLMVTRRWCRGEPFEEYVDAVRLAGGRIPFASTVWRTVSSAFSVASGATVGREGSMIQFATAVTSWSGRTFAIRGIRLSRQVAWGAAAAVAAVYQAPVAGVFFALEIVLGEWAWSEVLNLTAASLTGWLVGRALLGGGPLFAIRGSLSLQGVLWTVPLAVVLGTLGPMYQKLLRSSSFLKKLPLPLVWSGLVVGLLSLKQTAVWGNGDFALLEALSGVPVLLSLVSLLLFRMVATTMCVGTGTVGGVFTPTLFTGAALGLLGANLAHVTQPVLLAVVGMSVFLAAVTHAPFMAAVMAVELTGQWHLLPELLLLNLIAYQVAKRISPRSLYAIASPEVEDGVAVS